MLFARLNVAQSLVEHLFDSQVRLVPIDEPKEESSSNGSVCRFGDFLLLDEVKASEVKDPFSTVFLRDHGDFEDLL